MKKLTKKAFKEWILKQNPNIQYKYLSNTSCLVALFCKEVLNKDVSCGGGYLRFLPSLECIRYPKWLRILESEFINMTTFGQVQDLITDLKDEKSRPKYN